MTGTAMLALQPLEELEFGATGLGDERVEDRPRSAPRILDQSS